MGKILVFGDSIAYGKWDIEGGWVARLRKYIDEKYNIGKNNNFQVYNLGIPGDITLFMAERFKSELLKRIDRAEKNVVLLAIGINDSCPNNSAKSKQTSETEFKSAFSKMITSALENNCKVAVIGLTPVNPEKSKGLKFTNEMVKQYDTYISEICEENNVSKLDLFDTLSSIHFGDLLVDSVHPNADGHKILASKIIEFLDNQNLIN